jgi:hypothetical protein
MRHTVTSSVASGTTTFFRYYFTNDKIFRIKLLNRVSKKEPKYQMSLKSIYWESSCSVRTDRRTDAQTDMTKLMVISCGLWHLVVLWKGTHVLECQTASNFRVEVCDVRAVTLHVIDDTEDGSSEITWMGEGKRPAHLTRPSLPGPIYLYEANESGLYFETLMCTYEVARCHTQPEARELKWRNK